jgi:predicted DNA-binding ribbon-helix-helix protein
VSRPVKRSFSVRGHQTSISLEQPFWDALKDAAEKEGKTPAVIVAEIDEARGDSGLSGAVRMWILDYYRRRRAVEDYNGGNRD